MKFNVPKVDILIIRDPMDHGVAMSSKIMPAMYLSDALPIVCFPSWVKGSVVLTLRSLKQPQDVWRFKVSRITP